MTQNLTSKAVNECFIKNSTSSMLSDRALQGIRKKYQKMEEALEKIVDSNMAPSLAMKDGPPKEATKYSKMIAWEALAFDPLASNDE